MKKSLKHYLILQFFISSTAFSLPDFPEDFEEREVSIIRRALENKHQINWTAEFDFTNPEDISKSTSIRDYLDASLSEEINKYNIKMSKLDVKNQIKKFDELDKKRQKLTQRQESLAESHSAWFCSEHYAQEARKREEEENIRKINIKKRLKYEIRNLKQDISNAASALERFKKTAELKMQGWLSTELGDLMREAREHLERLNSLDNKFLERIRGDSLYSATKVNLDENSTLQDAMMAYGESVMSITSAHCRDQDVRNSIANAFSFLYGDEYMSLIEAKNKLNDVAIRLKNQSVCGHLAGAKSEFLCHFEELVRMYCHANNELENLVWSQGTACKNGLNGRLVYGLTLILKDRLQEGTRDIAKFSETIAELKIPGFRNKKEIEEKKIQEELTQLCNVEEENKKNMENLLDKLYNEYGLYHATKLPKAKNIVTLEEKEISQKLETILSYYVSHYPNSALATLNQEERDILLQKAKKIVQDTGRTPDGTVLKEVLAELV